MDAERWQRLSPLLDALVEESATARRARLELLRGEDPALAGELEALLALEQGTDDFLAEPLVEQLPRARAGAMVGPYRLERMIGEGGMGHVWLASRADGLYERRVALKLLRPGLAEPDLRLRFTRERQILARLEHAHIARLLDAGISADQPYLALDYVDGEPITDWCRTRAPTLEARIHLFLQVCDAVSHAHANLIVHRDLKPSNILVTPLDEVRLLDFGIAKLLDTPDPAELTRTGLRPFTLHYAAPEQVRGEPVTTMTDVYALGVVLHEMLCGARPYRLKRHSDAEWEEAILGADPVRPSQAAAPGTTTTTDPAAGRRLARALAGDLDNIVLKALAKRPEQRYASVEALALDLRRHLDGKPVLARPRGWLYRSRKFAGRHRLALVSGLAVAMVLFGALGVVGWQAQQARVEARRAQALQDFMVSVFEGTGGASPGAPVDLRRLLEEGVARGDRELAAHPAARAELLGAIARLRYGLGDHAEALALQQRQARILAGLRGVPARLRLQAATYMARSQLATGDAAGCRATLAPLGRVARREASRLPDITADYRLQSSRCAAAD
jgi:serine/threonine protein kinase